MSDARAVRLYISGGSNIEPEHNLRLAWRKLRERYGDITVSPVYRTPAVGFEGEPFLNCVFALDCAESPQDVVAYLESLHEMARRVRGRDPFSPRTLDLDLLLYGDAIPPEPPVKVPRTDIRDYAFVLKPLVDIAPDLRYPGSGETMAELWAAFPGRDEPLERVELRLE